MKNLWNNMYSRLMDKETEGAGGGGSNSLLTPSPGGGGLQADKGNADPASGAGGDKSTVNAPASTTPPGTTSTDWKSSLPKELQEDASIKKFTDVSALAGAYKNAQKLIGADKIALPTKYTTDEEMRAIYGKLGVPEKVEDYQVKFKEGVSVDDKFSKEFVTNAHKLGVHPKQAQALADWFSDVNMNAEKAMQADMTRKYETGAAELKKEWGNAFDLNIARAQKVVAELGGPEMIDYFSSIGVGGDKNFIKFLAKAGETLYGEHKFVDGQGSPGAMTPQELDKEIIKLQQDPSYTDKQHPGHKAIVAEVAGLYQKRYPSTQKA